MNNTFSWGLETNWCAVEQRPTGITILAITEPVCRKNGIEYLREKKDVWMTIDVISEITRRRVPFTRLGWGYSVDPTMKCIVYTPYRENLDVELRIYWNKEAFSDLEHT